MSARVAREARSPTTVAIAYADEMSAVFLERLAEHGVLNRAIRRALFRSRQKGSAITAKRSTGQLLYREALHWKIHRAAAGASRGGTRIEEPPASSTSRDPARLDRRGGRRVDGQALVAAVTSPPRSRSHRVRRETMYSGCT